MKKNESVDSTLALNIKRRRDEFLNLFRELLKSYNDTFNCVVFYVNRNMFDLEFRDDGYRVSLRMEKPSFFNRRWELHEMKSEIFPKDGAYSYDSIDFSRNRNDRYFLSKEELEVIKTILLDIKTRESEKELKRTKKILSSINQMINDNEN